KSSDGVRKPPDHCIKFLAQTAWPPTDLPDQVRKAIRPHLPNRQACLHLLRGIGTAVCNRQPLTLLLPLVLWVPFARPHHDRHDSSHKNHRQGQQNFFLSQTHLKIGAWSFSEV